MIVEDVTSLRKSKNIAEKRLDQVWKQLDMELSLQLLYSTFIGEYKTLNHIDLVEESKNEKDCYYAPYHGVYRSQKVPRVYALFLMLQSL